MDLRPVTRPTQTDHRLREHTDDDLLVAGADTLLHAALRLVRRKVVTS